MYMPSLTPPGQVRMINKLGDGECERVFQVLKEGGRKRVQVYIKERRMRKSQMDETFGSR